MSEVQADKSHPSYSAGYFAAFQQEHRDSTRASDEQYQIGYAAGERAAAILQSGGMMFDGEGYSVNFPTQGPSV